MKRGWAILLAGVLILAIALPATAKKPTPPTTTIPAVVDCQFDEDGILQDWWSEEDGPYRCRWTPSNRGPFTFHLTAGSADDDGSVLRPHMFVTDSYPYGEFVNDSSPYGDKCFDDMDNGWHDLKYLLEDEDSYAWESFSLPADGECDDSFPEVDPDGADVFSLVIAVRIKGTTPVVTVTHP